MEKVIKKLSVLLVAMVLILNFTAISFADLDEVALPSPVIYGDFNGWAIEGEDAYPLDDAGEGLFKGIYYFEAYDGEGDGYTLLVCITKVDYGEHGWGAGEQYTIDGDLAGFGSVSIFNPTVSGKYEVIYNSETNVTTIELHEVMLPLPVIYGDFNGWAIEGEDAYPLEDAGGGLYKAIYHFDAYDGDGDGYTLLVCITKVNYGEWGWGAGEQYTIDGDLAGFGSVSIFNPEKSGDYEIIYNSETNETSISFIEESPVTEPGDLSGNILKILLAFLSLSALALAVSIKMPKKI